MRREGRASIPNSLTKRPERVEKAWYFSWVPCQTTRQRSASVLVESFLINTLVAQAGNK